jgi:hypothetical protein
MERASNGLRFALIAGAWVFMQGVMAVLSRRPDTATAAQVFFYVYVAFCLYTWFAAPITRFLLARRYPWLKDAARV